MKAFAKSVIECMEGDAYYEFSHIIFSYEKESIGYLSDEVRGD